LLQRDETTWPLHEMIGFGLGDPVRANSTGPRCSAAAVNISAAVRTAGIRRSAAGIQKQIVEEQPEYFILNENDGRLRPTAATPLGPLLK
jgi:hypothetical protein